MSDYAKVFSDTWNANRTVGLSGHTPDGEAYLEAIHGGRAITRNLASKLAELRVTYPTGVIDYDLKTGQLLFADSDVSAIRAFDIPSPDGYWSGEADAYRIRHRYEIVGLVLTTAQEMFDWPIYRAAAVTQVVDPDRTLLVTAVENAHESLTYAIDNDHYASDDEGDTLRASLLKGWASLLQRWAR